MDEIWRDIPNTNGKYQASNYGRIKSFARTNELMRKILILGVFIAIIYSF